MDKKHYEEVEIEIIKFSTRDVITSSGEDLEVQNPGGTPGGKG